MNLRTKLLLPVGLLLAASLVSAQPPGAGKEKPDGPGGPPGKGRFGGPPRPGQLIPGFLQNTLKLTPEQKKEIEDLQKEVDGKLEKILTPDQRKQLQDMRRRGPGGFGPPPGFGPPGPPGGRPGGGAPPGKGPEGRPEK